jgi:hypothetical protein
MFQGKAPAICRGFFCFSPVIACNKRKAFVQGSGATKQSILAFRGAMDCFASLAMTADVRKSR